MPRSEIACFETPDYERGVERTLERLFDGRVADRLGIKRPNYLSRPEVPERIHRHFPDADLICVLRHPVDRAVSAYFHYLRHGLVPPLPVEEGMRRLLSTPQDDPADRSREVLSYGLYGQSLSRYLERFSRDKILVLFHEDLLADRRRQLRTVFEFLRIDPSFMPPSRARRRQGSVYSVPRARILHRLSRIPFRQDASTGRYYRRSRWLSPLLNNAVTAVDRALLKPLYGGGRPQLTPETTRHLMSYYASDVELLSRLLGGLPASWEPDFAAR